MKISKDKVELGFDLVVRVMENQIDNAVALIKTRCCEGDKGLIDCCIDGFKKDFKRQMKTIEDSVFSEEYIVAEGGYAFRRKDGEVDRGGGLKIYDYSGRD